MPFTDAQVAKIKVHLGRYLKRCPVCGANNFVVGELITPPISTWAPMERYPEVSESTMPMLPAVCKRCSHTMLFAWAPIERGT